MHHKHRRYLPDLQRPSKIFVSPYVLALLQAIRVALQGLEELHDCNQTVTEIENQLMDRVFCVKVHGLVTDRNERYAIVTFYDTSGEDDINVNNILFEKIMDNIVAASKMNVTIIYLDYN